MKSKEAEKIFKKPLETQQKFSTEAFSAAHSDRYLHTGSETPANIKNINIRPQRFLCFILLKTSKGTLCAAISIFFQDHKKRVTFGRNFS